MKRIAQIGTFNVDNLGDLLFPVVFAQIIDELSDSLNEEYQIDFFSPNCIDYLPSYSDQKEVKDIEQFNNQFYDKVFLGGGDLLRSDDWSINKIYNTTQLSFTSILSPTNKHFSNGYTIGLGVPFELEEGFSKFVENSFKRFNEISVRDSRSQKYLSDKGMKSVIIPDLVLSISKYFPKNNLNDNIKNVFERNAIPLHDKPYIIFQANESVLNGEEIINISSFLNDLSLKLDTSIILLSIGECLGDNELYNQLVPLLNDCYVIDKNRDPLLSLLDKVALLANAKGFIGSSLHGNIISYSYNIPHVTFTGDYSTKLKGFFDLINRVEYCFKNPIDVVDKISIIENYFMREMNNSNELDCEINKIVQFVKQSLIENMGNENTTNYSSELDYLYKMEQLVITEKNIEISNLWKRVNIAEANYNGIENINSQLWKRVNDSESELSQINNQNDALWKRVNETEAKLKQDRISNEELWKRVNIVESQNEELKSVINNLNNLLKIAEDGLFQENKRIGQIEEEYYAMMNSFTYYLKSRKKNRGN